MFTLHKTLEQDTFFVRDLELCRVLLMNNKNFPWLILVPRRENIKEIIDLTHEERLLLMEEICRISEKIKKVFSPDKINIGALGNMVPQLHIHIIARYTNDSAWPQPVWGKPSAAYSETEKERVILSINE